MPRASTDPPAAKFTKFPVMSAWRGASRHGLSHAPQQIAAAAFPAKARGGGSGHDLPLMKADDVAPDVPPASLNPAKDPDEWVTKDE